jgi:hypothetical protein
LLHVAATRCGDQRASLPRGTEQNKLSGFRGVRLSLVAQCLAPIWMRLPADGEIINQSIYYLPLLPCFLDLPPLQEIAEAFLQGWDLHVSLRSISIHAPCPLSITDFPPSLPGLKSSPHLWICPSLHEPEQQRRISNMGKKRTQDDPKFLNGTSNLAPDRPHKQETAWSTPGSAAFDFRSLSPNSNSLNDHSGPDTQQVM